MLLAIPLFAAFAHVTASTDDISGMPESVVHSENLREGRQLAAEIAAIYWQYEEFAEIILESEAERAFISNIAAAYGPPYPANLADRIVDLNAEMTQHRRDAAERHDLVELLTRAPGTANIVARYVRWGASIETAEQLLDIMAPDVGRGGLHPLMFESVMAGLIDRRQTTPADQASSATRPIDEDALISFEIRYTTWIDNVRLMGRLEGRDLLTRSLIVGQFGSDLSPGVRASLIEANRALMDPIDAANSAVAMTLVEQHGFATIHADAPILAGLIVSIIQHATLSEQRAILAEIEPLALSGAFDGQRYALMYDRVAEAEQRPQRYGTQDSCIDDRRQIYQLENPSLVDIRRAEMGLGPLDDYWSILIDQYGEDC
ncbi:DUF6624 domain-containing protein [Hyphobacterium sp.]|uniref:DUF6624 domain-containing protein n=1 Tax=Hyphobacterium sp. TaxID=2004662 RepID=UPI003BABD285